MNVIVEVTVSVDPSTLYLMLKLITEQLNSNKTLFIFINSSGTGYPESSNALSLIPPQDTWTSLAAATSSMSPHGSIQSSCAQYGSVWPATVSSASYSSHVVSSSSTPLPTSLIRASVDATNSPSPPSGSPYHQSSAVATTSTATPISNSGSCTIYPDNSYHEMLSTQDSSAFTSQMSSTHSTNPAHHHSSAKVVSSPWSPLTPPSVWKRQLYTNLTSNLTFWKPFSCFCCFGFSHYLANMKTSMRTVLFNILTSNLYLKLCNHDFGCKHIYKNN